MSTPSIVEYDRVFSICRRILDADAWGRLRATMEKNPDMRHLPETLHSLKNTFNLNEYIDDIARLELALHRMTQNHEPLEASPETLMVNPSLILESVSWANLDAMIGAEPGAEVAKPVPKQTLVMLWQEPKNGKTHIRDAGEIDLLALKIVAEQIDLREAAAKGQVPVGLIQSAMNRAVRQGILISPDSRIRRSALSSVQVPDGLHEYSSADVFTLQWHITQACDLHCKHCYDRSDRVPLTFKSAIAVLDEFFEFCCKMHVAGQVTFTGGNPLLYPRFDELYKEAFNRGLTLGILGNPTPIDQMENICAIAKPSFFQISLEGLPGHNDRIRGEGHFRRSMAFLEHLKQLDIYTMVMLTLTHDNMDQVLPLADLIEDRIDSFNFNRLSTVGEGAQLMMPSMDAFKPFLKRYAQAAEKKSKLGLKDNLLNIVMQEDNKPLIGGCTGYGCGAAFNFIALLPDGEVHACRKFPSLLGNIFQTSLMDIYYSDLAKKYRSGSEACQGCSLSAVCRGCLAITYSCDRDIFNDRDPYCFLDS